MPELILSNTRRESAIPCTPDDEK